MLTLLPLLRYTCTCNLPQVAQASEYEYLFYIVSVKHNQNIMTSIGML